MSIVESQKSPKQTPAGPEPTSGSGVVPYRLSVDQFLRMIDLDGFFPDKPEIELIDGILVTRMTKRRPHSFGVGILDDFLREILPPTWHVEIEAPVVLNAKSRPEPDVSVVRGTRNDFRNRDPQAADVGLIVEVAESTYRKDRNTMLPLYAAAGIPAYWIVNLAARRIETYSDPQGSGEAAEYRQSRIYTDEESAPVVIDGVELGAIPVRDILP